MNNKTEINTEIHSNTTQINNAVNQGEPVGRTVVNTSLFGGLEILTGTILCGKYKVSERMNVESGEASLFICDCEGKKYVAKVYRRDVAIKDDVVSALKRIDSPYVAKIYDTGVYEGSPFEILPFYKFGSLQGKTFSFEELKKRIIPSLNEGLRVLHQNGIIHKDLKPSNIMLCDNETDVVIIDFGISSVKDGSMTVIVTKTGMTPEYSASETFRNLFLEESDYYSLGITLYELFCGKTPYSNMSSEEIEQYVSIQRIPFPSNMPTELCNLIAGLTYGDITHRKNKSNPNRRWTYDEVKNWCEGIYQQIPGEGVSTPINQIPAYRFMKQQFTDTISLVDALATNWEDGKKQLFRGLISGFFKNVDPEIAGYCMDAEDAYSELKGPEKKTMDNLLFFRTLYRICPVIRTFYWRGNAFDSLPELGNNILEKLRKGDRSNYGMYDEILSLRAISEYVSLKDENNEKLIAAARSLEDRFNEKRSDDHEKELTYYLAGYMLSGQRSLIVGGVAYGSVDELVSALRQKLRISEMEFQRLCDGLIDSAGTLYEQFEAWLITLGKYEELEKWRSMESR